LRRRAVRPNIRGLREVIRMPMKLRRRSDGHNPFGELIGLCFEAGEKGSSRCKLDVRDELLNTHRVLHGGVTYSMADTGMGAALYTLLEEGESCATIEIKIVYLKPVTGGCLTCVTKVVQKGKRIAVLESEVENDGRLVAKALGTFSIVGAASPNNQPTTKSPQRDSQKSPLKAPHKRKPREPR